MYLNILFGTLASEKPVLEYALTVLIVLDSTMAKAKIWLISRFSRALLVVISEGLRKKSFLLMFINYFQ
jgi:hypothetical protein